MHWKEELRRGDAVLAKTLFWREKSRELHKLIAPHHSLARLGHTVIPSLLLWHDAELRKE